MPVEFPNKLLKGSGTYFRVAYFTQLDLSRQADQKSHLMLGLSTLILSVVLTKNKFGAMWTAENLWLPNLLLLCVCLSVAVLAILASRPVLPRRPALQRPNWIFFGSYAAFSFDDFQKNFRRLMQDDAALQEAMSRDLFQMGKVLGKKYFYLSYCYLAFGLGVPLVALVYIVLLMKG
ncbi:MAG: hypothetical protein IT260_00675 [Saprospiraceae bacterium]|nr:hypothetical protein [Saprospiraceae bacterium]